MSSGTRPASRFSSPNIPRCGPPDPGAIPRALAEAFQRERFRECHVWRIFELGQGLQRAPGRCHWRLLFAAELSDDLLGLTFELEDVQPGVRAVDDVDASAVVRRDVVCLDHLPADVWVALVRAAAKVGVARHGGDEERHVLRVVRIADVEGAHASVKVRDEDDLLVERRPELLIGRVWTEAAALIAEVTL